MRAIFQALSTLAAQGESAGPNFGVVFFAHSDSRCRVQDGLAFRTGGRLRLIVRANIDVAFFPLEASRAIAHETYQSTAESFLVHKQPFTTEIDDKCRGEG